MKYKVVSYSDIPKTEKPVMFDIETDASPNRKSNKGLYGQILLAQFYCEDWDCVYIVKNPNPMDLYMFVVCNIVVCHNGSYELSCIQEQYGTPFPKELNFYDTLIMYKKVNPRLRGYSLDACIFDVLGRCPYTDNDIKKTIMAKSFKKGRELTEAQLQYGAIDVFYLLDVFKQCLKHENSVYCQLYNKSVPIIVNFQNNGIPVSQANIAEQKIKSYAAFNAVGIPPEVNVNSVSGKNKVSNWIGTETSDAITLAEAFYNGNERAGQVRKARKHLKRISFCDKYLKEMDNGRLYGRWSPTARSGRCKCDSTNLQQVPRDLRHLFETEEGKVFIYSDFSQLELRCFAAGVNEPDMARIMKDGGDIHSHTAKSIYGDDFTKQQRFIGKTMNFQLLYGCGPNRLRATFLLDEVPMSFQEAMVLRNKWYDLWQGAARYKIDGEDAIDNGVLWRTPLGLEYLGNTLNDQLNIKIQGFGNEVALLALNKMNARLTDEMKLCVFVYDCFLFEVPDNPEIIKELSTIMAESMKSAWEQVSSNSEINDIPMPISVMVDRNWGKIEDETCRESYTF